LTADQLEDDKELRGLLADDLVRSKDGKYNLALEREKAEIYVLAEKTGLNIPYLVTMGAVYAAFFGFIFILFKRRKRSKE
jgi:alpha-amylase